MLDGERDDSRRAKRRFVTSFALLAGCPALNALFSRHGSALFPAYRNFSRAWIALLSSIASVVPLALWDCIVAVLVAGVIVSLVRSLRRRKSVLPALSALLLAISCMAFAFVAGWALNHFAPPLANEMQLEVREYSVDELADATGAYLHEAAELADQVPRHDDGSLARQDFFELARVAGAAYAPLAERYPIFQGPTHPVKALLIWGEPLLYSGHTGIFWAPTGESCVPLNCPAADAPYIMCHEAAHRLGLASEQEANFAAYLACRESSDARLAYSGALNAFGYCFNALYRYDPECATALLQEAAEENAGVALVWNDRIQAREAYDAYEGTFERVGTAVNDTYLRSFGETEGVRSYGLVVDYLIAWQLSNS